MEGPTALNNGAYRGQENGEVRQAPPKTTETPSEQHSDPDYDDVDDKGKNTTSSRNPVYGEGPPRTAHNQVIELCLLITRRARVKSARKRSEIVFRQEVSVQPHASRAI
jgi:hypothetical protein